MIMCNATASVISPFGRLPDTIAAMRSSNSAFQDRSENGNSQVVVSGGPISGSMRKYVNRSMPYDPPSPSIISFPSLPVISKLNKFFHSVQLACSHARVPLLPRKARKQLSSTDVFQKYVGVS